MAQDLAFVPMERMPAVAGLSVPGDAYWILKRPAPLLGMARPTPATPWNALWELGVRRVVCLTDEAPAYDPSPLTFACAVELQDLYGGIVPTNPADEEARVEIAVSSVLAALRGGDGVVVHCAGGTGRTGTVLGATRIFRR
jgi:protein-tyrosine phosphatase